MDMNCATYRAKGPIILANVHAARSTAVDKVTERMTPRAVRAGCHARCHSEFARIRDVVER